MFKSWGGAKRCNQKKQQGRGVGGKSKGTQFHWPCGVASASQSILKSEGVPEKFSTWLSVLTFRFSFKMPYVCSDFVIYASCVPDTSESPKTQNNSWHASYRTQRMPGCALAEPGGPWHLTFALGRLENLRFFIQIICWVPWMLQVQSTGLPSIFLRAQPWNDWDFLVEYPVRVLSVAVV